MPQPAFQADRNSVCSVSIALPDVDHAHFSVPLKGGEGPQLLWGGGFLPVSPNVPNCSSSALLQSNEGKLVFTPAHGSHQDCCPIWVLLLSSSYAQASAEAAPTTHQSWEVMQPISRSVTASV